MKKPKPADVKRLHAAGCGRNETARRLGVSRRQVDRVADKLGLEWNTNMTEEAVTARRKAAENERRDLGDGFREVALDCVTRALLEEEDTAERRRLVLTAEAASRSDLALFNATGVSGDRATEELAAVLETLRGSFATLDSEPLDDLEDVDDYSDEYDGF
ncbi:hypothetical protein [Corynebacterium atrinae]|uniref:hypothetical protein n=1 Tax=Corynebacterium atrinae TaxID=1336740 RepID=UPI0025B2C333|nr:hypothetical protein [Corynebacterium atrinae]